MNNNNNMNTYSFLIKSFDYFQPDLKTIRLLFQRLCEIAVDVPPIISHLTTVVNFYELDNSVKERMGILEHVGLNSTGSYSTSASYYDNTKQTNIDNKVLLMMSNDYEEENTDMEVEGSPSRENTFVKQGDSVDVNRIIGFILYYSGEGTHIISQCVIQKELRGQKRGSAMLKALLVKLRVDTSYKFLKVSVPVFLCRFFLQFGFRLNEKDKTQSASLQLEKVIKQKETDMSPQNKEQFIQTFIKQKITHSRRIMDDDSQFIKLYYFARHCVYCNAIDKKTFPCSECRRVHYCSKECMTDHYKTHQYDCQLL